MKKKPEICFSICSIKPGPLPSKISKCVLCEEDCYFSGFGNEDAEKFNKGEYVDLEKYNLKIVCTDCTHGFFEKELILIMQIAKIPQMEKLLEASRMFMGEHIRNENKN